MVKTKVFVGNLSFKTQDADLAKEFEVAGKVASTNIIARGSRSLGYGFVEMESEEEARKAVELLNKKQLDGREINVELAKPTDENAIKEPRPRNPRPPRQPRPAGANAANNNGQAGEGGEGEEAPRRRRPNTRRRGPGRKNADGTPAAPGEAGGAAPGGGPAAPRRERAPRAPRAPRTDAPRVAAPNSLFIANLPFTVDDAGLAQIFAGLNLKAAHVVRKHNSRSKGFAFAEFNSEDDQKKALAAVDKKSVDGRELSVKLARTEPAAAAGVGAGAAPGSPAVAAVAAEQKKEAAPASPKTA